MREVIDQKLHDLFLLHSIGTYDVGIRQIEGHKVEFVDKPRTFCFRGLAAKDEKIYVYRVAVDSGLTAEKALEMFNEAKETEVPQPTERNGWLGRGVRRQIVSGFYIDERNYLRRSGGYGKKVRVFEWEHLLIIIFSTRTNLPIFFSPGISCDQPRAS